MNFTPPDLDFFKQLQHTHPKTKIRLPLSVYAIPNEMADQKISLNEFVKLLEAALYLKFSKVERFLNMAIEHNEEFYLSQARVDETNANYMFHTLNKAVIL